MKLELTIPPTTNNLFLSFTRKGKQVRVKTKEYRTWMDANYWPIRNWNGKLGECGIALRIIITIRGGKGFPENSDIDNRIKAVLDLLKTCGVIAGDSVKHIREVRAVYLPPEQEGQKATCTVEIFPVGEPIQVPKARAT